MAPLKSFVGGVLMASMLSTPVIADDIARIVGLVDAAGHGVPDVAVLKNACDADGLCAAKFLRDRIGDSAELIPDENQPRVRSKWGSQGSAITSAEMSADATLTLQIERFDREAVLDALSNARSEPKTLVFDIRTTWPDQKLHDMRRVAGLFTGKVNRAFRLRYISGKEVDWTVPSAGTEIVPMALEVWMGPETDAVGEAFAALLRKHANARLLGKETTAHGYLFRRIPVTHGWTLRVPYVRIVRLDEEINVGLKPDGGIPEN